jgi:hypothetical protein
MLTAQEITDKLRPQNYGQLVERLILAVNKGLATYPKDELEGNPILTNIRDAIGSIKEVDVLEPYDEKLIIHTLKLWEKMACTGRAMAAGSTTEGLRVSEKFYSIIHETAQELDIAPGHIHDVIGSTGAPAASKDDIKRGSTLTN